MSDFFYTCMNVGYLIFPVYLLLPFLTNDFAWHGRTDVVICNSLAAVLFSALMYSHMNQPGGTILTVSISFAPLVLHGLYLLFWRELETPEDVPAPPAAVVDPPPKPEPPPPLDDRINELLRKNRK